jgi:excisionase family DNA binding protein
VNKKYLNKKEVAELIGVTVQTIDDWRRAGKITYIKLGETANSAVRFDRDDVLDWMERRKHNTVFRGHLQGIERNSGFEPEEPSEPYESTETYDQPPDLY